jgi:hypothetical protein
MSLYKQPNKYDLHELNRVLLSSKSGYAATATNQMVLDLHVYLDKLLEDMQVCSENTKPF